MAPVRPVIAWHPLRGDLASRSRASRDIP